MHRKEIKIAVVNNIRAMRRATVEIVKKLGFQNILTFESVNEIADFEIPRRGCLYIIEFEDSLSYQDDLDYLAGLASLTTFANNMVIFTTQRIDREMLTQIKLINTQELILKNFDFSLFSKKLNLSIERLCPKLQAVEQSFA